MKQNFFDQLDGGWGDLITDTYKEANSLIPKYSTDKEGKIIVTPLSDKRTKRITKPINHNRRRSFLLLQFLYGDLVIPDSVISLGTYAFENCDNFNGILKLSNQLKEIQLGTFKQCSGLRGDLVIPDSVTKIESYSFYKCKHFTSLKLSSNIEFIGQSVFANCINMTGDLIIPESVKEIHYNAFNKCNFEKIYIPKHLKEIKTFLGTCIETAKIIIY